MARFSRKHRSYSEKLFARRKALRVIGYILASFIVVAAFQSCFLQSWTIGSASMRPALEPGERIAVCPLPFGSSTALGRLPALRSPRRGELVLVSAPGTPAPGFAAYVWDSFVRFFTFQRISPLERSLFGDTGPFSIRRVIAVPGDTLRMENWQFFVKAEGSSVFRSEFELSGLRYAVIAGSPAPAGWKKDLPGSGYFPETKLGPGEFFVACDSRGWAADSLLSGPLSADDIRGDVFLRFWPLKSIGFP